MILHEAPPEPDDTEADDSADAGAESGSKDISDLAKKIREQMEASREAGAGGGTTDEADLAASKDQDGEPDVILSEYYAQFEEEEEDNYESEPDDLGAAQEDVSSALGYIPGFAYSPFYRPDPELSATPGHIAYLFHVLLDLCGYGDFQAIENVQYAVPHTSYWEGGRNWGPHQLPFEGVGAGGELTLRWGMINRPWVYEWMRGVEVGGRFRRSVTIFHLDRRRMPQRIIRLTNAWPIEWRAPDLNTADSNYPVEQLTLAYEGIRVFVNSIDVQSTLDTVSSL
jgi:phage tail-like protein